MPGKLQVTETKDLLIQFARHPLDKEFSIPINGGYDDAQRCLSRLRTELSRAKQKVKDRGKAAATWQLIRVRVDVSKSIIGGHETSVLVIKRTHDPMQRKVQKESEALIASLTEGNGLG